MKNQGSLILLKFLAIILIVGLACAPTGGTPTAIPPTATQAATKTPVPPTDTPAPSGPFEISSELYTDPSEAISFHPPEGWTVEDTDYGNVFYDAPDHVGSIAIFATNTGYELDQASYENFVRARENNYFYVFDNYDPQEPEYDKATNTYSVEKSLDFDDKPQTVISYYFQQKDVIFAVDFWAEKDVADEYHGAFAEVRNDMKFDPDPIRQLTPYLFTFTLYDTNNYFKYDVPTPWTYSYYEDGDCYVDTMTSPDGLAFVENVTCQYSQNINQGIAGQLALQVLNNSYTSGAGDIKITKDETQPDGSEKLTWTSKKGGYSGVTFFETRKGSVLLLLTMAANDQVFSIFDPTFGNVISTYGIP